MQRLLSLLVTLTAACNSPEGSAAPSVASKTTVTKAPMPSGVADRRLPCSAEIEIECPEGYEDGCVGGKTTSIVCVRKGQVAKAMCDQQVMLNCPDGEINSCYAKPRYGDKHVCVRAPSGPMP